MEQTHVKVSNAYPRELHHVKALFLSKQYRRCVTACRELLDGTTEPLQLTFIQFFMALSHDELARAIHNFSQAKIPAFCQAEQLYRETLQSLPVIQQCVSTANKSTQEKNDDPFIERGPLSRYPSSTTLGASHISPGPLNIRSPPMSPHIRNDSLTGDSASIHSPGTAASDFDELESHDSYNQIMTPTKVLPKLERDYSSMSLLQPPPLQMSQGLMRQIRVGEPPKRYHVPPRMPFTGGLYSQTKWPGLQNSSARDSPVRSQLPTESREASPARSPIPAVSPLGSESVASDASTISSLYPDTPTASHFGISDPQRTAHSSSEYLSEHLEGMRVQLETHIKLLQEAKGQAIRIQSERAAARLRPTKQGRLTALFDAAATDKKVQQSPSFWSFTPSDVKAIETQRRVEAGRERGWVRVRFDPTRYRQLAETALAEL